MATRKIRNTTGSDIYLTDFGNQVVKATGDPGGDDVFEMVDQESPLKQSTQIFNLITAGDLIVLDANDADMADEAKAWAWLIMDTVEPPKTKDGDWHMVQENFAHVTDNNVINWTVEQFLGADTTFSEKMVIPNGRTVTINFLEGGSADVSTHIKLEWLCDIGGGDFMRCNPEIRVGEIVNLVVVGGHDAAETVITIDNANDELDYIETGLYYAFQSGSDTIVHHKVTAIDDVNDTITLESGLAEAIVDGTVIALIDRVVGQKGNQISSSIINWSSPPQFYGDGVSYLLVTITNEEEMDSGLVSAMINGWHTDTGTGD